MKYLFLDSIDFKDKMGNNALHLSIVAKDKSQVIECLNAGISVNETNGSGLTPIALSVSHGSIEIFKTLVSHGGDMNEARNGSSCLDILVDKMSDHGTSFWSRDLIEIFKILLKTGCSISDDRKDALKKISRHSKIEKEIYYAYESYMLRNEIENHGMQRERRRL